MKSKTVNLLVILVMLVGIFGIIGIAGDVRANIHQERIGELQKSFEELKAEREKAVENIILLENRRDQIDESLIRLQGQYSERQRVVEEEKDREKAIEGELEGKEEVKELKKSENEQVKE